MSLSDLIKYIKSRFKNIYEYITHIRLFAFGKLNIHNCTRNLHYWEEELSRGVYCSICGKTVSQETYEPYERPIDIDEDMAGSWSVVPSSPGTEAYEPTSWDEVDNE
jgi:hypothetical protein